MKIISSELYVKDNKVYHEGNKPKPKDIGAAPETHTHNYASATTPGGSAEHAIKATEDSLGQRIDTYIKGLSVSGRTITYTRGDGTTGTITTQDNNTDTKVTNTLNTTAKAYITGTTNSATNTGTQVFDTNVYLDTTAGTLTATTFKGALQGNAATATSATSAASATQLATARTINGTSFNGTGNITTANWGTARNIQIGNSSKSVNGSSNMTWTLAEIGAAPDGHTHSYLPLTGGTMTGVITSSINTGTHLDGNKGKSIINSTNTAGGYTALIKSNSTNGYFTQVTYQGNHLLQYTAKSTVDAGTNGTTKSAVLLNESGNTSFPGTVTAPTFSGALNGNATSSTSASHAARLTTPRTINGTNFDGTAAITTSHWGTARTLTIGNTGKSVNGSGNVSWSIGEIGAAPAVHNHTSLTGITNLSFATDSSDAASITTTVDGTNTYFDFNLSDDAAQNDMWRWRFTPSGGTLFNAMTLDAISTTEAKLTVTGEVQATRLKGTLTGNVTGNVTGTVSGNAGSATKLATPRTINGTNFDGTAAITTANWGTARTIKIGNAGKSVNGSGNVTWTLAEIGAAAISHEQDFAGTSSNTYIAYPKDGRYRTTTSSLTGYLKITLPQTWTSTMMRFEVDVYNYLTNETMTYIIGGYNYSANSAWINYSACCISHPGNAKRNLTVRFGHDGTKCAIYIGEASTTWAYTQVTVKNITVGYSNNSLTSWNSGWAVGFTTTLGTVTGTVTNPYVGNGGMASTANTLATARTINGTSFNGSANITTANWGTARNIYIADNSATNTGPAVSVNGSGNATLKLPANIKATTFTGALSGNASTATKLATARTISLGGILKGSATFDGSGNVTISASANDITTITKSLNVTTSWADTGITGTNLATGTYAVQMLVNDGTNTSQYNEHYSGIMSWFADITNSTDADEILLHKAGHASNGRHVYLRTIRTGSSGRLKLQISTTNAFTAASSITFKFKKLI